MYIQEVAYSKYVKIINNHRYARVFSQIIYVYVCVCVCAAVSFKNNS